jgi:hypothetical protein
MAQIDWASCVYRWPYDKLVEDLSVLVENWSHHQYGSVAGRQV